MRLSLFEMTVLEAVTASLPGLSSVAKITKATGKSKEEVLKTLNSLGKLQLISVMNKNEVLLRKDGREYLGLPPESTKQPLSKSVVNLTDQKEYPSYPESKIIPVKKEEELEIKNVFNSLDALGAKLNSKINDKELKTQVLQRLSEMLSDDIAGVLLAVRDDLDTLSK